MILSLSSVVQTSFAATEDTSGDGVVALVQQAEQAAPSYEGITVEQPTKASSAFGTFWRGIKENVTLAFTFDPNKKAETAMKFADERLLIAQKDLESTDEKAKGRAQQNMERANTLMKKVQTSQEEALKNPNKDTERLLKNRAAQAEKQQQMFDEIETKAGTENIDKVLDVRAQITEQTQRLDTAINNDKIPEDVRAHLKDVKARIEEHATEIKDRVEQFQLLKEAVRNGDTSAQVKLEELKTQRFEEVKKEIDTHQGEIQKFQDKMTELKASAEKGDKKAVEMMKQIQDLPNLKNQMEDIGRQMKNRGQQEDEQGQPPEDRRGPPPSAMDQQQNQQGDRQAPRDSDDQGQNKPKQSDDDQQIQPQGMMDRVKGFFKPKGDGQKPKNEDERKDDTGNDPKDNEGPQGRGPNGEKPEGGPNGGNLGGKPPGGGGPGIKGGKPPGGPESGGPGGKIGDGTNGGPPGGGPGGPKGGNIGPGNGGGPGGPGAGGPPGSGPGGPGSKGPGGGGPGEGGQGGGSGPSGGGGGGGGGGR